jgi:ribosomal protein S18 acetylase RimI-like enzyme
VTDVPSVTVRPADVDDLDQVVDVFLGCWRETYAAVLPRRLVDTMTDEGARELWARAARESAPGDLLVALGAVPEARETPAVPEVPAVPAVPEVPARIVGVARLGPVVGTTGHLASLYVSPRAQGLGVGRRLMEAALTRLAVAGATSATLWVFRDNAPSIAFYRHLGWAPDRHERTQPEFGEPELRLARSVGPAAPTDGDGRR